jgi:phosphatidylglycerol:prolipoprotein diacylglycerol transferase
MRLPQLGFSADAGLVPSMIQIATAPWAHMAFDLAAWGAGLGLSAFLYRWRLREIGDEIAAKVGGGYFVALVAGAIGGSWLIGSLNTLRDTHPILSHSALGALVGAVVAVEAYKIKRGLRGALSGLFVGPFALGIAIGRFGCLFAGLPDRTFGRPAELPWAVDLGDGIGRHPVQIYESVAMALFLIAYLVGLRRRQAWALRRGVFVLCAAYGAQRFFWEFLKPYPPVVGSLNLFHLLSGLLVVYGVIQYRREVVRDRMPVRSELST